MYNILSIFSALKGSIYRYFDDLLFINPRSSSHIVNLHSLLISVKCYLIYRFKGRGHKLWYSHRLSLNTLRTGWILLSYSLLFKKPPSIIYMASNWFGSVVTFRVLFPVLASCSTFSVTIIQYDTCRGPLPDNIVHKGRPVMEFNC